MTVVKTPLYVICNVMYTAQIYLDLLHYRTRLNCDSATFIVVISSLV